jgi:predicted secreted protein
MAKSAGRLAVLALGGTPIGGVKVTTIKFTAEPIDVTDRDSAGVIELLAASASEQVTLTVTGWAEDVVLRALWSSPGTSKLLTNLSFRYADALAAADTVTGNFFMTDYEENNPDDNATDFSATFVSSGPWATT